MEIGMNKKGELKTHFHPETTLKEQGNYRQFTWISTHHLISGPALTAGLIRAAQKELKVILWLFCQKRRKTTTTTTTLSFKYSGPPCAFKNLCSATGSGCWTSPASPAEVNALWKKCTRTQKQASWDFPRSQESSAVWLAQQYTESSDPAALMRPGDSVFWKIPPPPPRRPPRACNLTKLAEGSLAGAPNSDQLGWLVSLIEWFHSAPWPYLQNNLTLLSFIKDHSSEFSPQEANLSTLRPQHSLLWISPKPGI